SASPRRHNVNTMSRSLGPKALSLLERWEADGSRVVSLTDVRDQLGNSASSDAAKKIVRRLSDSGFLRRVGRGVYAVQPLAWMGETAPDVAASLGGILKRGGPFFVGFDTAAGHFGWHPEAYGVVTIAMPRHGRVRPGQVEGSAIRTITVDDSTFRHGV